MSVPLSAAPVKEVLASDSMLWVYNARDLEDAPPLQAYIKSEPYEYHQTFTAESLPSLVFQWVQFGKRVMKNAGKLWDTEYPKGLHDHLKDKRILIVFQNIQKEYLPWLRLMLGQTKRPFPHYVILSLDPAYHKSYLADRSLISSPSKTPTFVEDPLLLKLEGHFTPSLTNISSLIALLRDRIDSPFTQESQEWLIPYINHIHKKYTAALNEDSRLILASLMLDIGHYYTQTGHYDLAESTSRDARGLCSPEKTREELHIYINTLYQIGRIYFYHQSSDFARQASKRCLEKANQLAQAKIPHSLLAILIQRNGLLFHARKEQKYEEVFKEYTTLASKHEVTEFDNKSRTFKQKHFSPSEDLQHKATCLRYQVETFLDSQATSSPITRSLVGPLEKAIRDLLSSDDTSPKWAPSLEILLAKIYMFEKNLEQALALLSSLLGANLAPDQRLEVFRELIRVSLISNPPDVASYAKQYFELAVKTYGEGHRKIYEMAIFEKASEFKEDGFFLLRELERGLTAQTANVAFIVLGYSKKEHVLCLDIEILVNKSPPVDLNKIPEQCKAKLSSLEMSSFAEPSEDRKQLLINLDKLSLSSFKNFLEALERKEHSKDKGKSKQQNDKLSPAQAGPSTGPFVQDPFHGPIFNGNFVTFKSGKETCTLTNRFWEYLKKHGEGEAFITALNLPAKERKETPFFNAGGYRLAIDKIQASQKAISPVQEVDPSLLDGCSSGDEDDAIALDEKRLRYETKRTLLNDATVMNKEVFEQELFDRINASALHVLANAPADVAEQFQEKKVVFIERVKQAATAPAPALTKKPFVFSTFEQEEDYLKSRLNYLGSKKSWHQACEDYRTKLAALKHNYVEDFGLLPPTPLLTVPKTANLPELLKTDLINQLNFKEPLLLAYHTLKHFSFPKDAIWFDQSGGFDLKIFKDISDKYLASVRYTIQNFDLLTEMPNQQEDPTTTEYAYRKFCNSDIFFKMQDELTRAQEEIQTLKRYQEDLNLDQAPPHLEIGELQKSIERKCKKVENLEKRLQKENRHFFTKVASKVEGETQQIFIRTHFENSDLDSTRIPHETTMGCFS